MFFCVRAPFIGLNVEGVLSQKSIEIPKGELLSNGLGYILILNGMYLATCFILVLLKKPFGTTGCKLFGLVSGLSVGIGVYVVYGPISPIYFASFVIWVVGWWLFKFRTHDQHENV